MHGTLSKTSEKLSTNGEIPSIFGNHINWAHPVKISDTFTCTVQARLAAVFPLNPLLLKNNSVQIRYLSNART